MRARISEIVAQAVRADGSIDRARVLELLQLSPNDPVSLIVDAVCETRALADSVGASLNTQLVQLNAECREAIVGAIGELRSAVLQNRDEGANLSASRDPKLDEARIWTERLLVEAVTISSLAVRLEKEARLLSNRTLVLIFGLGAILGTLGGIGGTLLIARLLKQ